MKRIYHFTMILLAFFVTGCTVHIKPEKFDVYPKPLKTFLPSSKPIKIIIPANAEQNYPIHYKGKESKEAFVFIDLNDINKNIKSLLDDVLTGYGIRISDSSEKHIKIFVTKIVWETWASGFSVGAYLDFYAETGDGYKMKYHVQDGSSQHVSRAVGGAAARAVEAILQDENIIAYIEQL